VSAEAGSKLTLLREPKPGKTKKRKPPAAAREETQPEPEIGAGDRINLNKATFEHLRDVGFSVTQATRVITYRERQNGFESLARFGTEPPQRPKRFEEAAVVTDPPREHTGKIIGPGIRPTSMPLPIHRHHP